VFKRIPKFFQYLLLVVLVGAIAFSAYRELAPQSISSASPNHQTQGYANELCASLGDSYGWHSTGNTVLKGVPLEDQGITTDVVICHYTEGDAALVLLYMDDQLLSVQ